MKIIVIGLGYFGKGVAVRLSEVGHEVICVDNRMGNIDAVKDSVSATFVFDATDEGSLSTLPIAETDLCIVTIGEDLGASVRIIALLKKLGAAHIFVRASDPVHRSIVEAFHVDRIVMPEDDSARDFVAQLQFTSKAKTFAVSKGYGVFRFEVPEKMVGKTIKESGVQSDFGLQVLCLIKAGETTNDVGIQAVDYVTENNPSEESVLQKGDILVCYGAEKGFKKLAANRL